MTGSRARPIAGLCGVLLLMLLRSAHAQGPAALEIVQRVEVPPNQAAQFETALKQFHRWLGAEGERWTWEVWEVTSGTDAGRYVIRSSGHTWKDLADHADFARASAARWKAEVAPFTTSNTSSILMRRADLSWLPAESEPPATLLSTNIFVVRYERYQEFASILPQLADAMTRSKYVYFRWSQLVNGGDHYTLMMDFPKRDWAGNLPASTPYWTMIEQVHGKSEAERMRAIWFGSIASHRTATEQLRPDLSYVYVPQQSPL